MVEATAARRRPPQRLAHRRHARPPSTVRSPACCRCTTSPTRAHRRCLAAAPRAARAGTTSGTAAPTRCRARIALADAIVAVSPTHAREILTPAGGFGLDGALRHRWAAVGGILNGIDTAVWDPADRSRASSRTTAAHDRRPSARQPRRPTAPRRRERVGFPDDDVPLAVVVARLTGQKGADLLVPIVPILRSIPLRLVVLGSGEADIAARLRRGGHRRPGWFALRQGLRRAAGPPARSAPATCC